MTRRRMISAFEKTTAAILLIACCVTQPIHAAQSEPATRPNIAAPVDAAPQPELTPSLSTDATWAGVLVIVAAGLFVAAACIGPIIRANLPERFERD